MVANDRPPVVGDNLGVDPPDGGLNGSDLAARRDGSAARKMRSGTRRSGGSVTITAISSNIWRT